MGKIIIKLKNTQNSYWIKHFLYNAYKKKGENTVPVYSNSNEDKHFNLN